MSRNVAIANRIREVLLNGKWIANTNVKEQISGITWEQAIHKVGNLNTIALLTFHLNYYVQGILHFLESGELLIKDKYSFDLPLIKSEADWNKLVSEFLINSENLANKVEQMNDRVFDQNFVDEKYGTYLRNLDGIIEHSYYHLGQISLIKKLVM